MQGRRVEQPYHPGAVQQVEEQCTVEDDQVGGGVEGVEEGAERLGPLNDLHFDLVEEDVGQREVANEGVREGEPKEGEATARFANGKADDAVRKLKNLSIFKSNQLKIVVT